MMFTGNPGVGKTTVSRLVAKLYHQLGVSSKDTVVEVQKGDLVAGYVNQTAMKTSKKIREARGGILFVDEAYQLTQALQRGQSDFSGESIDEMMKVMNNSGRRATTFVFARVQEGDGRVRAVQLASSLASSTSSISTTIRWPSSSQSPTSR